MVSDWRPTVPQVEIDGRSSVIIDGCRRICEYEPEAVKVSTGKYNIRVIGRALRIVDMADGCIRIDGCIMSVDLCC